MKFPIPFASKGFKSDRNEAATFQQIKARLRLMHAATEAAVLVLVVFALGSFWYPGEEWNNLTYAITIAFLFALTGRIAESFLFDPAASKRLLVSRWVLLREMLVPAIQPDSANLTPAKMVNQADKVLGKRLSADFAAWMRIRRQRLLLPGVLALVVLAGAVPDPVRGFRQMASALSIWRPRAEITILKGDAASPTNSATPRVIAVYRHRTPDLDLLEGNLIEISVMAAGAPVIELRESAQNFVMMPSPDEGKFSITLTVSRSTEVYLNNASRSVRLASIKVLTLPVPKVSLSAPGFPGAASEFGGAWYDDKPLQLKIAVKAEAPVASVKLLIRSGKQESVENVLNVLSDDRRTIDADYSVTLEPYVDSDEAEVTLIAVATDRAVPQPLTGASEPLRIPVLSSYGRYRRTLATLRELKSLVDDAAQSGKRGKSGIPDKSDEKEFRAEAQRLAAQALRQSAESPYFDALDRNDLAAFNAQVNATDSWSMIEVSADLGDFLFAHESIDQRERDRDFFVAMRTLSRVLQVSGPGRESSALRMLPRLHQFLDERHKFWVARVARLGGGNLVPSQWPSVRDQKPFHALVREVRQALDAEPVASRDARAQGALGRIARGVAKYRAWIEELEQKEDEARKRREAERQQGLASTENELRDLQRRQGEISAGLDRAQARSASEIEATWPGLRSTQNGNLKGTKGLEGKMRAFAPGAEVRLKAAVEQMEQTVASGNGGRFPAAESSSDMAGRLLRQAEQAAQKARDSGQDRGRRRRVNGDNYYGQSITGGDVEIKREYEVDRKYREDILDEVSRSRADEADKLLLDRYTREIVR